MHVRAISIFILLCFLSQTVHAQDPSDSVFNATKTWWTRATFGDTAYVRAHSTEDLAVTYSNGRRYSRTQLLSQIAQYNPAADITDEWSDVSIQRPVPDLAILTNSTIERVGNTVHHYKYITVLVRRGQDWKIADAQSTRELALSPRIPVEQAGRLEDFAGQYLTPGGLILRIAPRGNGLVLTEPSGAETLIEPVGPGLFEFPKVISAGLIRFSFNRDASGKVTSLTRIAHNVIVMKKQE